MSTRAAFFLVALAVYGGVAGTRLFTQSTDPHFVLQADAWLHGRLSIDRWPQAADDPAIVQRAVLDDGRVVSGRRLFTRPAFRIAGGEEIPLARVVALGSVEYFVGFPPVPAVILLPLVLMFGRGTYDILATVILAALIPVLCLAVLQRLRERGLSTRSPHDDRWLAVLLSFGTVVFFSAVQGRVWYTAHIVAVDLALLFVWASIDAERPGLAGILLGLAFLTRGPLLFMLLFFVVEMWRTARWRDVKRWILFAAPIVLFGMAGAWHNWARFGEAGEFGYHYLAVRQQAEIESYGLFSLHYLPRNLVAAFALLPDVRARAPYVRISGHGLAMWLTTPPLLLLPFVRPRGRFHLGLWTTAAALAVWGLLYQNTGWVQFGYRFSLDYMVFLVLLLAVDSRPLTVFARTLIVVAVAINLFGAVSFGRSPQFYRTDLTAYRALVRD